MASTRAQNLRAAAEAPRLAAGLGAAALAVVAWASPAIIVKVLPLSSLTVVFFRGWIGVAWALAFLHLRGGRVDARVLRATSWAGLALGIDLICFFTAIKLTTVANATLISAMPPVLLIFLAPILFKERIRWPDATAALIAIGGAALVSYGSAGSPTWSLRGDSFAVVTLFAWTAYLIASKKATSQVKPVEFTAGVTLIASALVTPLVLLSGRMEWPEPFHFVLLGVMAIGGWTGHVLMNWSLRHIPVWAGGAAALAVPVVSTSLAALVLGEQFLPIQMLGMGIVMVSLTIVGMRTPQVVPEPSADQALECTPEPEASAPPFSTTRALDP